MLQSRGTFGIVGVLGFMWSAAGVFGGLSRAINGDWGVKRPRPVWAERAFSLGLVLLVALLFFVSLFSTAPVELVSRLPTIVLGEPAIQRGSLFDLLTKVLPYTVTLLLFVLLYRVLPFTRVAWAEVLPAAVLASLAWEVAKYGFAFHLTRFAFHSLVYGSLAAVIVFLLWSYMSGVIILLGADFSAQYARRRRGEYPAATGHTSQMQSDQK